MAGRLSHTGKLFPIALALLLVIALSWGVGSKSLSKFWRAITPHPAAYTELYITGPLTTRLNQSICKTSMLAHIHNRSDKQRTYDYLVSFDNKGVSNHQVTVPSEATVSVSIADGSDCSQPIQQATVSIPQDNLTINYRPEEIKNGQ